MWNFLLAWRRQRLLSQQGCRRLGGGKQRDDLIHASTSLGTRRWFSRTHVSHDNIENTTVPLRRATDSLTLQIMIDEVGSAATGAPRLDPGSVHPALLFPLRALSP